MSYEDALSRDARRVLWAQALMTLAVATGFALWQGMAAAIAASYGGAITLLLTGWLAWRLRRVTAQNQGGTLAVIYSSAALRYVMMTLLIGTGIASLHLAPLPLLVTFAVTQFGFLVPRWRGTPR
jgi:ATP synthase protein I